MLRTGGSHRKVALLYCSAVAEHVGQVLQCISQLNDVSTHFDTNHNRTHCPFVLLVEQMEL